MRLFFGILLCLFSFLFSIIFSLTLATGDLASQGLTNIDLITPLVASLGFFILSIFLITTRKIKKSSNLQVYSGFFIRFISVSIDVAISTAPYLYLRSIYQGFSGIQFAAFYIIIYFLPTLINTVLLIKFGTTIGKYICKLKVLNIDFSTAKPKSILIRSSIDYLLIITGVLICLQHFIEINLFNTTDLSKFTFDQWTFNENKLLPKLLSGLSIAWIALEMIVILFNKKSRALHDYLAGTVVVRKKYLNKSQVNDL